MDELLQMMAARKEASTVRRRAPRTPNGSLANSPLLEQFDPVLNPGVDPSSVSRSSSAHLTWRCPAGHRWRTSVNNRANGRGCPECSTAGTSRIEAMVRATLNEHAGLGEFYSALLPVPWGRRRTCSVDAHCEAAGLVVEYDGRVWHDGSITGTGLEAAMARDRAKSEALSAAGYQVVRIREVGLPLLEDCPVVQLRFHHDLRHPATGVRELAEQIGTLFRPR